MTRAEHFAKAKRWRMVAGLCLALAVAAILTARASDSLLPHLVGVLALLGVGVAVVSAGYRMLMGFSRPADWRPLAGEPLDRFDPEEEEHSLRKRIKQELGRRLTGELRAEHENIVESYPEDERSVWQRYLQSSEPMLPRYRLTFSIPTNTHQIVLKVWIGRSKKEASFSRIRVVLECDCHAALSAPVRWQGEFAGESEATALLAADGEIAELLSVLVRKRILSGGRWVFHPDPCFLLEPQAGGSSTRATLDTVEQDWKGGFVVKLGLDGFLTAVDRIEALLGEASSTKSA